MPAKSPLNGTPRADVVGEPAVGEPNRDLEPGGQHMSRGAQTPDSTAVASPAQRLGAERTERRHQRMLAREASTATREPQTGEQHERVTGSPSAPTPRGHRTLGRSVSATAIAAVAAGGVLGAMLGALSVAGWVIGLLAAGLTVFLSSVIRGYSRSA
jgi:hypothetical protein